MDYVGFAIGIFNAMNTLIIPHAIVYSLKI